MTDDSSDQKPLKYRRAVLRDGVNEEMILRVALEQEWGPPESHPEERGDDDEVTRFREVNWISDDRVRIYSLVWEEIPYMLVRARFQQDADRGAQQLEWLYPALFHSAAGVLRAWDEASEAEQKESAAFHLGLIASPTAGPEPEIWFRIGQALEHPSPGVREAAIRGIGFARWPELKPALEKLAKTDDDEYVRELALAMFEAYAHFGWGCALQGSDLQKP